MANEIRAGNASGLTLYGVAVSPTGQFLNGAVPEAFNPAHWPNYAVTLSEQSTTGIYLGSMPAAPSGNYLVCTYIQSAKSPSLGDVQPDAPQFLSWTGSGVESVQTGDAFARLGSPSGASIAADIQTRSTYAGGPVSGVAGVAFPANFSALAIAPSGSVTAGSVADKAGYSLAPGGLDPVAVEPGVNARQAVSAILASSVGVLSGAATSTVTIQGANSTTPHHRHRRRLGQPTLRLAQPPRLREIYMFRSPSRDPKPDAQPFTSRGD